MNANEALTDHLTAAWRHLGTVKEAAASGANAMAPALLFERATTAAFLLQALIDIAGSKCASEIVDETNRMLLNPSWSEEWVHDQLVARDVDPATLTPFRHPCAPRAAGSGEQPGAATPAGRWRVGHTLGRTIYLDGQVVGLVDTPQYARAIVDALNHVDATAPHGVGTCGMCGASAHPTAYGWDHDEPPADGHPADGCRRHGEEDWADDPNLGADDTMRRFNQLTPLTVVGELPHVWTDFNGPYLGAGGNLLTAEGDAASAVGQAVILDDGEGVTAPGIIREIHWPAASGRTWVTVELTGEPRHSKPKSPEHQRACDHTGGEGSDSQCRDCGKPAEECE